MILAVKSHACKGFSHPMLRQALQDVNCCLGMLGRYLRTIDAYVDHDANKQTINGAT